MERKCVASVTREDYRARRREYWEAVNRECGAQITGSALTAMVEQDAEAVEAAGVAWLAEPQTASPRPSDASYRSAQEKLAPAIDLFCELFESLNPEEKVVVDRLVADKFGAASRPVVGVAHG
jgi:hypothetical protein